MHLEVCHKGGANEQRFELPTSDSWRITIGSSKEADFRIKRWKLHSVHAVVSGRSGKVFVEPSGDNADVSIDGRSIMFPTRIRINKSICLAGLEVSLRDPLLDHSLEGVTINRGDAAEDDSDITMVRGIGHRSARGPGTAATRIMLSGDQVVIGRTIDGPGCVDDPQVSREHAVIRHQGENWVIRDSGSTNGTFVNGELAVRWCELKADDVVAFGSLLFSFDGKCLNRADNEDGVRVDVLGLTKTVRHRDTGESLNLIDGVDLSVLPGEFVVMLGSSGCGKSTFMDAINGRRRSTSGQVLFNGRDLYDEFPSLKRAIGYVPQEVIYHKALPVGDILLHAAHLRLPTDTTAKEIEERIQSVLDRVDLGERRKTPAAMLSGGQQKRVSIAIELLSRPKILFLDEVTSGLDMKTEREMMGLFRQLADDGITIFCITHHLESLDTCHHIAYFFRGKLAFFGPKDQFQEHFEIDHPSKVYDCEEGADPGEWDAKYRKSKVGVRLLADRLKGVNRGGAGKAKRSAGAVAAEQRRLSAERTGVQTATLTRRYIKLLLADRATLGVTIALAPVIGAVMAFASASWPEAMGFQALNLSVMAITIVFFFGLFTSSREIVRDLPVYLHERMAGLEIIPYLVSRIVPLAFIGLLQVIVFVGILRMFTEFEYIGSVSTVIPVLYATTLAGSMLGLMISAMVDKVDTAVSLMIFALVPQLLFAGNLGRLEHPQKAVAAALVSSYWAYDAAESLLEMPGHDQKPQVQSRRGGQLDRFPVQPEGSGNGDWLMQTVIILGQAGVFLAGTFLLVLRRDGAGAIKRFFAGAGRVVQTRNKDDLLVMGDWVAGASRGLRKTR